MPTLPQLDESTTKFFEERPGGGKLGFVVAIYRDREIELFDPAGKISEEITALPINKPVNVLDFDSIATFHSSSAVAACWTDSTGKRKWWWS
jgi:hypothetical protein